MLPMLIEELELPAPFGEYELLERIGTGGMAEIFRARKRGPSGFEKVMVIKRVLPELAQNRAFINLLIAEARVTSLLNHPNIVQIHELGDVDGTYYIAMEFVDGADLLNLLSRCTKERLRVPMEVGVHIVSEVARGLAHAHAATDREQRPLNIIHRDVSPSNILISRFGDVKIMDFGVARADLEISVAREQDRGILKGKLGYMSPEQVTGRPIDRRSDIFALGVVLFECLTLKRLFVGQSDAQTLLNIRDADVEPRFKRHSYLPKAVRQILRKALAKEPDDRYQTATDFQEALLDYLFDCRLKVTSRQVSTFVENVLNPAPSSALIPATPESPALEPEVAPPPLPPPTETARALRPRQMRRVDLSRATFHFRHDEPLAGGVSNEAPRPAGAVPRDAASTFGPLDFDRLLSLLSERAIGPREWVSVNGSDWLRAEDVRAIVDLMPSLFEEESQRPLDDGPLNRLRAPSILFRVAQHRLTGKLKLTVGTRQKEIFFDKGEPRYAHSNLKSDLFGAFLVRRGLAAPEQIEQALERVHAPQTHLGHALTELGAMSAAQVARALSAHLAERIQEVLTWRDGWFEFFEGVLPPRDLDGATPDLARVTMDGIRAHYDIDALHQLFGDLFEHTLIVGRDTGPVGQRLGLTPGEERARPVLRTGHTLRALLDSDRSEAPQADLLRTAFALHQTDHLAFKAPEHG